MSALTVGFSITDEYRPRLERLVERHSPGNRSEFLRQAIEVMERHDRAQDLAALQEYGEILSRRYEVAVSDVPSLQSESLEDHTPEVRAAAREIVSPLKHSDEPPDARDAIHPLARIVVDQIASELGLPRSSA